VARLLREESALRAVNGFLHRNVSWALSSNGRGSDVPRKPATGRPDSLHTLPTDRRSFPRIQPILVGHAVGLATAQLPSTTTARSKPMPPLAQHGLRQLRASGSDSGRRPAGHGYRAGDHADPGHPRGVAARRIGALDELTRFGHSRRGNARIADVGCPDAWTPNWTPDTGRSHRTADTRTPGRLDAHTGHWTPVAWTLHAWTLDAHTGHWTPDAAEDRTG
jgi:hypothetical protein